MKAETQEPQPVAQALELMRALYAIEANLRQMRASAQIILAHRQVCSAPLVDRFSGWVRAEIEKPALLHRSPLAKALAYVSER